MAPQPRDWAVVGDLEPQPDGIPIFDDIDRAEVCATLAEMEPIGNHLGGAFTVVPVRMEVRRAPGGPVEYATVAWQWRWQSLMPTVKQTPAPGVEDEASWEAEAVRDLERAMEAEEAAEESREETREEPHPRGEAATVVANGDVPWEEVDPDEVTPAGASVDHPMSRG